MKRLLTIAGSDCCGGAGLQADLKTFQAFGCYGMSAVTAVTVQNSLGVHNVQVLSAELIIAQISSVSEDLGVDAIKTGMLNDKATVEAVAQCLADLEPPHLVVDPVLRSSTGTPLLDRRGIEALATELIPLADLVTPNIPEAEVLGNLRIESTDDMKRAAERIHGLGARNLLIKGGHRRQDALDLLFDGERFRELHARRIPGRDRHGTGCALSAAIAAGLALGQDMYNAVSTAKEFVARAITEGPSFGQGFDLLNHLVGPTKDVEIIKTDSRT